MRYEIVVMGTSLGGLAALKEIFRGLGPRFPLPVVVVQHVGTAGTTALAELLQRETGVTVREAEDKEEIGPGAAYLAPAGYHLLVEERGQLALVTDGPILYARPSIDVLFESAADSYGERVIGVALTASSQDGVRGLQAIKARGGMAIVQDPVSAESPVLPNGALAVLRADRVLPLTEIAPFLRDFVTTMAGVGR